MTYPDEYLIGVQLFNQNHWFESHEIWEDLWKQTAGSDRDFLQGMIQVAVALCHFYNGNGRGAASLYQRGRNRLVTYPPQHWGLDLAGLIDSLDGLFAPLEAAGPDAAASLDTNLVPTLVLRPSPDHWPEIPHELFHNRTAEPA